MIIDWKDPAKEMPEDGTIVVALKYHWKNCWPRSIEIMSGEVESHLNKDGVRLARINTCDFTGGGSYCWDFPSRGFNSDSDTIAAWCYSREFGKPPFLEHNDHWGLIK